MKADRAVNGQCNGSDDNACCKTRWERVEVAEKIVDFEQARKSQSQREFAKARAVPRTTLQHWLRRKDLIDGSPVVRAFFESPDGNAFLHRMVTALHFEFTKNGTASIHNISNFMDLCGLSPFIACSYPTQRRVSNAMDDLIIEYGKEEQDRVSQDMKPKKISLCEDETFHPEICLVAIEPVSGFIIVEGYADNRGSETWTRVVNQGLNGLPVEVIQVVSDEARALISHATNGLSVHHSPDCFHVSYEIGKGISGAMSSMVKKFQTEYEAAVRETHRQIKVGDNCIQEGECTREAIADVSMKVDVALKKEQEADDDLRRVKENQETVRSARADIGKAYHPYDVKTGEKRDSEEVSQRLESCFEKIYEAIGGLSDRCKRHVDKAHRVVEKMVANIAFFYTMINLYVDNDLEFLRREADAKSRVALNRFAPRCRNPADQAYGNLIVES